MKITWNRVVLLSMLAIGTAGAGDDPATVEGAGSSIDSLEWMTGSWHGEGLGGRVEEHWSTARGASMIGMFRLVSAKGKTGVTEFMMIEQEDAGVKYRFRHFGAGHRPWEPDAPLEFDLVESSKGKAVFHSSVQAKPKRLTYRLGEDGALSITVQNEEQGELAPGFTLQLERSEIKGP
jgi:hypothetical protein